MKASGTQQVIQEHEKAGLVRVTGAANTIKTKGSLTLTARDFLTSGLLRRP
jgi:hypothetical protein